MKDFKEAAKQSTKVVDVSKLVEEKKISTKQTAGSL